MQALDCPSIWLGEGHVSTKVPYRAARLQTAHHIAVRQMLVFQTYRGLDEDPSFLQHPQRLPRQPQAQLVQRFSVLHASNTLLFGLGRMTNSNGMAEGRANHVPCAARPTFVKAWIFDQDGQVVTAPVVPGVSTGRTARDIIPANLSHSPHVVENAELGRTVSATSSYCDVPCRACR